MFVLPNSIRERKPQGRSLQMQCNFYWRPLPTLVSSTCSLGICTCSELVGKQMKVSLVDTLNLMLGSWYVNRMKIWPMMLRVSDQTNGINPRRDHRIRIGDQKEYQASILVQIDRLAEEWSIWYRGSWSNPKSEADSTVEGYCPWPLHNFQIPFVFHRSGCKNV
jgi:hypothetical protein